MTKPTTLESAIKRLEEIVAQLGGEMAVVLQAVFINNLCVFQFVVFIVQSVPPAIGIRIPYIPDPRSFCKA